MIDSTTPFELVLGNPGTVGAVPATPPRVRRSIGCQRATGSLSGTRLGPLHLGMTLSKAHLAIRRFSSRGRRWQDFYCLSPRGLRAGYTPASVLRGLARSARSRDRNAIVLLSTADGRYSLHGVHPNTRLTAAVARRLRLGRPFRLGANTWYIDANGSSRGIIKVHRGLIEEVGIIDKSLTATRGSTLRLMLALGLISG